VCLLKKKSIHLTAVNFFCLRIKIVKILLQCLKHATLKMPPQLAFGNNTYESNPIISKQSYNISYTCRWKKMILNNKEFNQVYQIY
jgi:hypothetical protein